MAKMVTGLGGVRGPKDLAGEVLARAREVAPLVRDLAERTHELATRLPRSSLPCVNANCSG